MVSEVVECRSKQLRRLCALCHQRKARFQYRGHVKADRTHTLCFECFRAEENRQRASKLRGVARCFPPGRVDEPPYVRDHETARSTAGFSETARALISFE